VLNRNEQLRDALRRAASALKADGPPFALGGSYALWVHGGPEPVHDVDFVVAEDDVELAAKTLAEAGFDIERVPEDWLFKASINDQDPAAVVDILHRLNGVRVESATVAGADDKDVLAIRMPVLSPTAVIVEKLRSLGEHHCDFAKILPGVRGVREQVDWSLVRERTADSPYAEAFLTLTDRLGITAPEGG
jgi:hypothetical protein